MKQTIRIAGMKCPHCEMHVKAALLALPVVRKAKADFKTGTAEVETVRALDPETVRQAVAEAGYEFVSLEDAQ